MKKDLSLEGSAGEIYQRASKIIFQEIIPEMIERTIVPEEQTGKVQVFKRRNPDHSNLSELKEITKIYDHIRMLDAKTYPAAFLETNELRIEFRRAKLRDNYIEAKVRIELKK